ncbi:hypothetical protein H206_05348 [Candidatus Electrothrix aarhusensis]|uniref:Uncharacterized protein n=1 Tax=Candidatus Electrothrix aarhusensis TaxID=1859131 RepID=A0A444J4N8_9BACT|nr:hypothetical protein H206_05348 [Candidatus Electrothrix aarhusensis]
MISGKIKTMQLYEFSKRIWQCSQHVVRKVKILKIIELSCGFR